MSDFLQIYRDWRIIRTEGDQVLRRMGRLTEWERHEDTDWRRYRMAHERLYLASPWLYAALKRVGLL